MPACRAWSTLQPRVEQVFAGGQMHITIEVTRDNGGYVSAAAMIRSTARTTVRTAAACRIPAVPAPQVPINDGYDHTRQPRARAAAGRSRPGLDGVRRHGRGAGPDDPIVAAATGTPTTQVPDLADLLWGPLLRGTVVDLS